MITSSSKYQGYGIRLRREYLKYRGNTPFEVGERSYEKTKRSQEHICQNNNQNWTTLTIKRKIRYKEFHPKVGDDDDDDDDD